MRHDYTDITVILDRSGSMAPVAQDMEGGFNHFIEDQRKISGECRVTLVQFDENSGINVDTIYIARRLEDVPALVLNARGGTPLLDAVGRTVVDTGERLKRLTEQERPGNVLILIITDGQENASRDWTKEKVRELINRQKDQWKWNFMFLGANVDAFAEARGMALPVGSAANYTPTAAGIGQMFASVSPKISAYRSSNTDTQKQAVLNFTDQERKDLKTEPKKQTT